MAPIYNRSPVNIIVQFNSKTMKINLRTLAVSASVAAGFMIGCASAPRVVERTDPSRPSMVQVQEGYDTVGRKWEVQVTQPVPVTPEPAPVAVGAAPQAQVISRTEAMARNFVGTITDIDYPNRKMTLRAADGRTETFVVNKDIRRFNEAKVGDKVSMDYYLGVTAEVRKPTPDELQNPLVVLDSESKTGLDQDPAGHTTRRVRAVVTIEGLDRTAQTVTVKGPRGNRFTTRVEDPSKFDQVRIGDTVLMTFTEAAGISLKPVD